MTGDPTARARTESAVECDAGDEGNGERETGDRREFLIGVGATAAALAGCLGSDGDDDTGDDDSDSERGENGTPDNESSANGDSNGEGSEGLSGDGKEFVETLTVGESYRFELDQESVERSGRVHEGDSYVESTIAGVGSETYHVDGDVYEVMGLNCFVRPAEEPSVPVQLESSFFEFVDGDLAAVTRTGTETIDGESVTVYEVAAAEAPGFDIDTRYYLPESGRPRRVETAAREVTYRDWGAVEPVTPPQLGCAEHPDAGDNGSGE